MPLGTGKFSESWDALREKVADAPRDAPIMTFCTGGIRCVKANAFLEQELGFTNTYRLQDGIHGYLRYAKDALPEEESEWQGENFVFYETGEDEGMETGERESESVEEKSSLDSSRRSSSRGGRLRSEVNNFK